MCIESNYDEFPLNKEVINKKEFEERSLKQKEIQNQIWNDLETHKEDTLRVNLSNMFKNNPLLLRYQGKENDVVLYLLAWKYRSRESIELEQVLYDISLQNSDRKKIIDSNSIMVYERGYMNSGSEVKNIGGSIKKSSDQSLQDWNWIVWELLGKGEEMADQVREAVKSIGEWTINALDRVNGFLSKIVDITDFPQQKLSILNAMLTRWEKMLNTVYARGWAGKRGIDCSHFVCWMFNAAGLLKKGEYLTSSGLFQKFKKNKVNPSWVRAGDLMFRGKDGGGHVEVVVWKPYIKDNGKRYVKTIWSSSDTIRMGAMYDAYGEKPQNANGSAYRERAIQTRHAFLRPQYM